MRTVTHRHCATALPLLVLALVHTAGDMDENLAIIEVKASTASFRAISSDIKKLCWFCRPPARYFCGLLLVYGSETKFDDRWPELMPNAEEVCRLRIALVRHIAPGAPAKVIGSVGL